MTALRAGTIILAGGLGTRIRAIHPSTPKAMIPVAGKPFIEWIIRSFLARSLARFVISLGYLSGVALDYFNQRPFDGALISTVCENEPMGTAGAFILAQETIPENDPLIVVNGDSLVMCDLMAALEMAAPEEVDGVIVGVRVEDTEQYGTVTTDDDGLLMSFQEKKEGQGIINAGIYILKRRLLGRFPEKRPLSMETEAFPLLLGGGARIMVCETDAPFIDIGTPEGLAKAQSFVNKYILSGDGI